jgi:tetratricopeptide (TPR) repeat protein
MRDVATTASYSGVRFPVIIARYTSTAGSLASWLIAHMARTGQSLPEVASDLGVRTETVRSWLDGRSADEGNEFEHLDTSAKLGDWLRARIAESGCSVRQLADSTAGVSMGTIYNWLRGEHLPRPPTEDGLDRFDLLLSNPLLALSLRQRLQLDEIRRRLTGTSLGPAEPAHRWSARGLPSGSRGFTGRKAELRQLDRLLHKHTRGRTAVVAALTGIGGVGKTALAVHWARTRDVRATFTDGCLYLNLNGYADTPPTSPDDAVTKLLIELKVEPQEIPDDPDAKAALYQESLAGRRLLIVLDNALSEPQVRPLLPADPNCIALVTSRNRLHGLEATDPGVTFLPLDTLAAAESRSLLRSLLGRSSAGIASDKEIDALAAACSHLPLAIRIASANYLTHHHAHHVTIGEYAATLAEDPLGELAVGPGDPATSVATALDSSYRQLSESAARMYRMLGLHPGPDLSAAAAASLTGLGLAQARSVLRELTQANLLSEPVPNRYAFHDLLRDYAAVLAERIDAKTGHAETARRRLTQHYLHSAHRAALLIEPQRLPLSLRRADGSVTMAALEDRSAALAWFDTEMNAVIAAIEWCADLGWDTWCWQLAWAMTVYFARRGHWMTWVRMQQLALASSGRIARSDWQADSHRELGRAWAYLERYEEARTHHHQALTMFQESGDLRGQAATFRSLGFVEYRQGLHQLAVEHNRQALDRFRRLEDADGQASTLNNIGWCLAQAGRYDEAMPHSLHALRLYRTLDNPDGTANAWATLGSITGARGHPASAAYCFNRALVYYETSKYDRYEAAVNLMQLADHHRAEGEIDLARTHYSRALEMLGRLEHRDADKVRTALAELDRHLGNQR